MRIGVFGGTFNPPHMGHLIVAEWARVEINLDKVIFIPVAVSPHKVDLDIVEAHHRVEMLSRAVQGNRYFEISEIEIVRGGISYTVDTLIALKEQRQHDSFHLLIGADSMREFHTWKSPETILATAEVVVLARPGFDPGDGDTLLKQGMRVLATPEVDIQSREIRSRVRAGKSIKYLVPPSVEAYIRRQRLYR